jgi:hypothetical protein
MDPSVDPFFACSPEAQKLLLRLQLQPDTLPDPLEELIHTLRGTGGHDD